VDVDMNMNGNATLDVDPSWLDTRPQGASVTRDRTSTDRPMPAVTVKVNGGAHVQVHVEVNAS
jgi:hypothetical protein